MSEINKARIAEMPLRNFKSVKIKEANGEYKNYSPKEFKKYLEDIAFGGKSLSQMEKQLIKAGIEGSQWSERKRLMELFETIANPSETVEAQAAKKKALEEFQAYLQSLESEEVDEADEYNYLRVA